MIKKLFKTLHKTLAIYWVFNEIFKIWLLKHRKQNTFGKNRVHFLLKESTAIDKPSPSINILFENYTCTILDVITFVFYLEITVNLKYPSLWKYMYIDIFIFVKIDYMKYIFERIFFDFVLHYNLLTNIKKYSRGNILLKTIYLLCIQKPKKNHNKFYF